MHYRLQNKQCDATNYADARPLMYSKLVRFPPPVMIFTSPLFAVPFREPAASPPRVRACNPFHQWTPLCHLARSRCGGYFPQRRVRPTLLRQMAWRGLGPVSRGWAFGAENSISPTQGQVNTERSLGRNTGRFHPPPLLYSSSVLEEHPPPATDE